MTKLVFINQSGEEEAFFGRLRETLGQEYPEEFQLLYYDCYVLDESEEQMEDCYVQTRTADVVFLDTHGGLTYFKGFRKLYDSLKGKVRFFIRSGIEDEITELLPYMGFPIVQYDKMERYIRAGGLKNYKALCCFCATEFNGADIAVEEPEYENYQGLYTPGGPLGRQEEDAYLKRAVESGKLVLGVLIHEHHLMRNDMDTADALYREIEAQGAFPILLVTNILPPDTKKGLGLTEALAHYLTPYADAVINTTGMSISVLSSPGDGSKVREESIFEPMGLPVFQAMQTYYTRAQWEESLAGLDSMMLSACVYQPEFDGQIITYPICTREQVKTPYGVRHVFAPIQERIQKLVRLACNYGKLRHIPCNERKVAVIFHNMPPRNDTIGCAFGLDTPASVFRMVERLKTEGVYLEYEFRDGQDIIERIIRGLSNDSRWLPPEEMKKRSQALVSGELYRSWFSEFGEKVRQKMTKDWGEPPGTFMTVEDELLVPGIINGNVFIGLQPPRALEEQAEASYHSTDLVCPHQYLAFYKWIEQVFGANVIVHVGTHGTIEWLPGKEIAMSKDCYPDIAIGCLPHLYPYNIAVTGEGMQAKRRTSAVLIGHLIPSMQESGTYGELEAIDDKVDEYYHMLQAQPGKLTELTEEIWELAVKLSLHMDLSQEEKPGPEEMQEFIERLHLWISKLKCSQVRDGLHVLGEVPRGELFQNLCRLLVRVPNGNVPSIRQAMGVFYGVDSDELMDQPGHIRTDGRTNQMLLEELDEQGRLVFQELDEAGYQEKMIEPVLERLKAQRKGNGSARGLEKCLSYVCNVIVPRIQRTGEELTAFEQGVTGGFLSPGPSGNPSRGNAEILPTGRNFYSVDPATIPSRAAWKIGCDLARQMLERERKEKGCLPESVAIVVYAGDTMKTRGDDLGEILYLLGIRPVWLGNTDRVIDLEVIPLEELGRPRIDVTLRISGLFRDTFPNLIERIEDAVNLVAALEEPPEQNFLRKHIGEEIGELMTEGFAREQAFDRASARIFGCPPGTYGAGVDTLVNSRKWESKADLGNIYIRYSGHAYGKKLHGEAWGEQFARRLSKTSVTIKNEPSVELDMLDSDDFYIYHGGLIAAVETASKEKPRSYSASTADPSHVETMTVQEDTARIMRSRIQNPKWLEGLKRHGYKGAQEVSAMVDIVFGWDATSDNIEDWMYDGIAEQFVMNEENRKWMEEVNPWAVHQIAERLLEAQMRDMWHADEEMLEQLRELYQETEGNIEEILE